MPQPNPILSINISSWYPSRWVFVPKVIYINPILIILQLSEFYIWNSRAWTVCCNFAYLFIQSILLLLNWCISPVRSPAINWAPRVDKSCINCTLYNCTAPLEYHSKSSTTVQQYNSTTNCTTVQLYSITTVPQQKQYNYTTVL